MNGAEVLIPLVGIIAFASIFIAHIASRHRERMAMVEKGIPSDEIKALYHRELHQSDPLSSLKWGLLLIAVGFAVALGVYLHEVFLANDGITIGLVCLFSGLALITFYSIASKRERKTL